MNGSYGDDTLIGGADDDDLSGGSGIDTVSCSEGSGPGPVTVDLNAGTHPTGGAGTDTFSDLFENLVGSTRSPGTS